jgi:hypothetical protein
LQTIKFSWSWCWRWFTSSTTVLSVIISMVVVVVVVVENHTSIHSDLLFGILGIIRGFKFLFVPSIENTASATIARSNHDIRSKYSSVPWHHDNHDDDVGAVAWKDDVDDVLSSCRFRSLRGVRRFTGWWFPKARYKPYKVLHSALAVRTLEHFEIYQTIVRRFCSYLALISLRECESTINKWSHWLYHRWQWVDRWVMSQTKHPTYVRWLYMEWVKLQRNKHKRLCKLH